MKNKETEHDDYEDNIFATEEAFNKRFRRVEGDELAALRKRIGNAVGEKKSRVTIYFDSYIVNRFKEMSESEGVGYQTLMNQALRKVVDGKAEENVKRDVKEDILKDKKFLKRLKTALST